MTLENRRKTSILAAFSAKVGLALITVVHGTFFGEKIGSLLVHEALRDQGDAAFTRGRAAGDEDYLRWLNNRSYTPRSLTEYLLEGEAPASPVATTGELVAASGSETPDVPKFVPSTGNAALIGKKATMAAPLDSSAMSIWLRKRLHLKPVKPISH